MFQKLSDGHNWSILTSECDSYARMVQIHSVVHRGDGAWRQSTAALGATTVARLSLPANRPRSRHCATINQHPPVPVTQEFPMHARALMRDFL